MAVGLPEADRSDCWPAFSGFRAEAAVPSFAGEPMFAVEPASSAALRLPAMTVTLISAGLDEVPMVYKNIREVMAAQHDLVKTAGQFDPKLVKMAPSGERPED